MFSFAQSLAIAILLSTANAFPKVTINNYLEQRAALAPTLIGLYVCTDINWKGTCQHLLNNPGQCNNLGGDLAKKISSVGPDEGDEHGASGCTLYEEKNCKGEHLKDIKHPGEGDLSKSPGGGEYNNFFQSYICY